MVMRSPILGNKAERYATDAEYRVSLIVTKYHDR
jgi:hypothetical protein